MGVYLLSFGAGILAGVLYGLIDVRSPAPPVVALVGLAGILIGEQIVPLAKRLVAGERPTVSQVREDCREHLFGQLPQRAPRDDARNG